MWRRAHRPVTTACGSPRAWSLLSTQVGHIGGVPAAVRARWGYWGCSVDPFIESQSGAMVTHQSPPGTIYNSSPGRPSPGEVVQIPARAVRIPTLSQPKKRVDPVRNSPPLCTVVLVWSVLVWSPEASGIAQGVARWVRHYIHAVQAFM